MELKEDYARAGFDGHLPFGQRPVVLIVDVCRAYLDPQSPLYAGVEGALAANVSLAAAVGVPVDFTRVRYSSGGIDGGYSTARSVPSPPISTTIRSAISTTHFARMTTNWS